MADTDLMKKLIGDNTNVEEEANSQAAAAIKQAQIQKAQQHELEVLKAKAAQAQSKSTSMATQESGSSLDPSDVLNDAIANTFSQEGEGQTDIKVEDFRDNYNSKDSDEIKDVVKKVISPLTQAFHKIEKEFKVQLQLVFTDPSTYSKSESQAEKSVSTSK